MNKDKYKYFNCKLLFGALLMFCCCACSDNESESSKGGAITPIMQKILAGVSYITSVEKEVQTNLSEGILITDATFTYATQPTRMLIAEVDLTKNVGLLVSTPNNGTAPGFVQSIPSQMAKAFAAGNNVLLGINGDYSSSGKAQGIFYKNAKAVNQNPAIPTAPVLSILKNGDVKITDGVEFQVNSFKENVQDALSGKEWLMRDGQLADFFANDNSMDFLARTFAGLSKDGKKVYLFVIEKGGVDKSYGMRLKDVMYTCQAVGCYQALNLAGGSTSSFAVGDSETADRTFELLNVPSTTNGEPEEVVNGLVVIGKK